MLARAPRRAEWVVCAEALDERLEAHALALRAARLPPAAIGLSPAIARACGPRSFARAVEALAAGGGGPGAGWPTPSPSGARGRVGARFVPGLAREALPRSFVDRSRSLP